VFRSNANSTDFGFSIRMDTGVVTVKSTIRRENRISCFRSFEHVSGGKERDGHLSQPIILWFPVLTIRNRFPIYCPEHSCHMNTSVLSEIETRLHQHNQQHLLHFHEQLSGDLLGQLLSQISQVDFSLLAADEDADTASSPKDEASRGDRAAAPKLVIRQPVSEADREVRLKAAAVGRQLLTDGKVAVITVAGGQGSRLGFEHPKGMYPIGPRSDRTLFQIFAEQIQSQRKTHGAAISWYLMTSAATHDETVAFFEQNGFFGLSEDTVIFFQQASLPAIDAKTGEILMDSPASLCLSPDGHGGMVTALQASGALKRLTEQGVEHLFYHQVDNPTVIMCDPVLLGLHAQQESQLTTNVVEKTGPTERMGVLVDLDSRTEIIEYSELTPEQAASSDETGQWIFWAGNTAIHVFRRDFLEYLTEDGIRLPLHRAHKKIAHVDSAGITVEPTEPNAIKFERFIFDALPLAERTLIVEGDRQREFNPVKNATGSDSPDTSRAALSRIGREWLQQAGQSIGEDTIVEISPLTALTAEELAERLTQGDATVEDLISE
jgi:UDP-N-acetylglucosamine/UDP-N-acetylgalactosamine diphosphorylase